MWIIQDKIGVDRLPNDNEELAITTEYETLLADGHHVYIYLTPVEYKQKQKGFKISDVFFWGGQDKTNSVTFFALGDSPVEMREEDVEMIMENGEWVKYERAITVESPNSEEPNTIMQGTTTETGQPVVTIAKPVEVQQSLSKEEVLVEENIDVTVLGEEPIAPIVISSNTSHFWLYVGGLLTVSLCVVLFLFGKRKK